MELTFRSCLRDPIAEIADAARYLDAAASAHLDGRSNEAERLIRLADMQAIGDWTESLWGKKSPYVKYRPVSDAPPSLLKEQRVKQREPTSADKRDLLQRDGYHCRFCGIPVIRGEVRDRIKNIYPNVLRWKSGNANQHFAFQAMWVQYDHLLPHARGGNNDLANMVIACAPCNFARMSYTLEEIGLLDPTKREPVRPTWDGLERFR